MALDLWFVWRWSDSPHQALLHINTGQVIHTNMPCHQACWPFTSRRLKWLHDIMLLPQFINVSIRLGRCHQLMWLLLLLLMMLMSGWRWLFSSDDSNVLRCYSHNNTYRLIRWKSRGLWSWTVNWLACLCRSIFENDRHNIQQRLWLLRRFIQIHSAQHVRKRKKPLIISWGSVVPTCWFTTSCQHTSLNLGNSASWNRQLFCLDRGCALGQTNMASALGGLPPALEIKVKVIYTWLWTLNPWPWKCHRRHVILVMTVILVSFIKIHPCITAVSYTHLTLPTIYSV